MSVHCSLVAARETWNPRSCGLFYPITTTPYKTRHEACVFLYLVWKGFMNTCITIGRQEKWRGSPNLASSCGSLVSYNVLWTRC
jgi:hypothetical protein